MSDPVPWQLGVARCGADVSTGAGGSPQPCAGRVTHVGLVLRERPLEAWLSFACAAHRGTLAGARELLDRDRATLADWAARWQAALDGQGWTSPGPLAVGAQARELVERATRVRPSG